MMVTDDRQMAASLDRRERRKRSDWGMGEAEAWCVVQEGRPVAGVSRPVMLPLGVNNDIRSGSGHTGRELSWLRGDQH